MELRQYINVLIKWWWLIAATVVVASVSSFLGTRAVPRTYLAHTTLMVGQALQSPNPTQSEFSTGQLLAESYADLARREPVLRATLESLGLKWDWNALKAMISSRVVPGTQLMEISVLDTDPQRAKVLADEIAQQLILQSPAAADPQKEAERQFILNQIEELKTNITKSQDEMRQLDDVIAKATSARQIQDARNRQAAIESQISTWQATYAELLTNLQKGSPNFLSVVEPAQIPTSPVGPRTTANVLLAAIIGLALSGGAAFLLEYIDDSLKTPEDVRRVLGLATLGNIPRIEGEDYPDKLIVARVPRSPTAEAYRMLRTNLQLFGADHPLRTLMVTSASPQEGKSVTAANLAAAIAQSGKRVILLDADMRRPAQHQIFGLSNDVGLVNILQDEHIGQADVLQAAPMENLSVLTSGPLPDNPAELLGSKRMGDLIELLLQDADIVILDSPPVMAVADATILAEQVDSTLLVLDSGNTRRTLIQRSQEALNAVGAHLQGVVLNRLSTRDGGYYYQYYYSEDGQRRRRRSGRGQLEQLLRDPFPQLLRNPLSLLLRRNGHSNGHNGRNGHSAEAASGTLVEPEPGDVGRRAPDRRHLHKPKGAV